MLIKLSSFKTTRSFMSLLADCGVKADALLNNAGYWPWGDEPVDDAGLAPFFASMHLSHYYLIMLLLGENLRMSVINILSIAHHLGTLMTSLRWPGRSG